MIDKQPLREYLTTLTKKEVQIGDDDSLLASKLLDSLKVVELMVFLETQYKVTFDGDEASPDNLDSINAMVRFLEKKGVV